MIQKEEVISTSGKIIPIKADTICIHGDGTHAVDFVKLLNKLILDSNIRISSNS